MRILVITNLYPDRKQPTFGTFVAAHVRALRRAGATVEVAAIRGVAVHDKVILKYATLFKVSLGHVIRALVRRAPPDVVEAHIAYPTGLIAWPLARISRARLVLYYHGADLLQVGRRSGTHGRIARFVLRRADLLVANSAFTRSLLLNEYGADGRRVVVWSPGIDTDLFHERPALARDPRRVLFVGRLDEQKGVAVLLDAMRQLSYDGVRLRIVGAGPEQDSLEEKAVRFGLEAEFVGPLPPSEVAREMAEAGVLVVPSSHGESLGLVAIEGMAAGAIVVASATGGLVETIDDGVTGWLATPADSASLSRAVRAALEAASAPDSPETAAMRTKAQRHAGEHDVYEIARRVTATYRRMTGAGQCPAQQG